MEILTSVYFKKIDCVDFSKSFTKADLESSPVKMVNVWDIHTQQESLCKSSIEEKKKKSKGFPLAVVHNGIIILLDGHHRAAAKIEQGHRQLKIRVFNLDKL